MLQDFLGFVFLMDAEIGMGFPSSVVHSVRTAWLPRFKALMRVAHLTPAELKPYKCNIRVFILRRNTHSSILFSTTKPLHTHWIYPNILALNFLLSTLSSSTTMPMYSAWNAFFPPPPVFTDKDLPSLEGKVYIVTGAATGIGLELSKLIYLAGGTIYVACRSTSRCADAITAIKEQTKNVQAKGVRPKSKGRLESMVIDFSDLATVKPAVEAFMGKENRLDVLVQNAGVMNTPESARNVQVCFKKKSSDL